MKRFLPLLLAISLPAAGVLAQRQTIDLPDHWKFIKHDAPPDLSTDSPDWQAITVPHCYNALDGQNGKAADSGVPEGYYRGPTWYQRTLDIPADWKEKRVFIRFEGAFLVSEVYLNGEKLGEHRGGFAAFCYELTPKLKVGAANDLRVRVNNARNNDVAPLSADFTMEGGIYRPVHLIVTDTVCITPLDYAGPGVYVTPTNIKAGGANVEVETKLDSTVVERRGVVVQTQIRDAENQRVAELETQSSNHGAIKQQLYVAHPHFWNGIKDGYLYHVTTKLLRGDTVIDEVTVPLGFRTLTIDNEKGFLLNGEPYPIYGVNHHQEKKDKGWALTDADQDQDFQLIREMGATAVRLAHYQQASHVHDIADKSGLLLWQEIPLVNEIGDSPAFAENAKQQLTEMIRQGSNHPSIMTWSTFNELYNAKTPPVETLIKSLDTLARELDPTRTPGGASCHPEKKDLARIPEWIGFNLYPGWYGSNVENFARDVRHDWEAGGAQHRIAITEYGAGANPAQHQEGRLTQPKPGGPWHPEEWQSYLHERSWEQVRHDPHVWGTFLWLMFDFASDGRSEGGTPGLNDKGMVTQDRKIRKDTFFFYKANWRPDDPLLYIASNRAINRTVAHTDVKAYTTYGEAELTINGKKVGETIQPSEVHVLLWHDVTLQPGKNTVAVTSRDPQGRAVRASCEWILTEAPALPGPTATP